MSDNFHDQAGINYELLVEDSLRNVVRGALMIAEHAGLPGESHFFITFKTDHPGVEMNKGLVKGDEKELTIVIQHQYWDLEVKDSHFSVTLSFSGNPETLVIPFAAVSQFTDPSVGFGLQFGVMDDDESDNDSADIKAIDQKGDDGPKTGKENPADGTDDSAEIVSLDSFRNRPKSD